MKIYFILLSFLFSSSLALSQYEFKEVMRIHCTEVKNQAKTGTCWSFATASFIEAEAMRKGHGEHNLSEMFVVQNIYKDKARNYIFRHGKANFSQGALAHDLMRIMETEGIVPEEVFSGLLLGEEKHNHNELEFGMKGFLDGVLSQRPISSKWKDALEGILESYLGAAPTSFEYNAKKYTPASFRDALGFKADEYINITSFNHHPFHESFILEIPDNYSNGSFYNVPIDEMMDSVNRALGMGYTIAWDGDVSEKSFSAKYGMAILPIDEKREDLFENPGEEIKVDQLSRQAQFETLSTTDDHLMHIIGKAVDKDGNKYYIIKNSWGEIGPENGYLYMSEAYMRMKTISVLMHQDVFKRS